MSDNITDCKKNVYNIHNINIFVITLVYYYVFVVPLIFTRVRLAVAVYVYYYFFISCMHDENLEIVTVLNIIKSFEICKGSQYLFYLYCILSNNKLLALMINKIMYIKTTICCLTAGKNIYFSKLLYRLPSIGLPHANKVVSETVRAFMSLFFNK